MAGLERFAGDPIRPWSTGKSGLPVVTCPEWGSGPGSSRVHHITAASGRSAHRLTRPLQRVQRGMNVLLSHPTLRADPIVEQAGRGLLGLGFTVSSFWQPEIRPRATPTWCWTWLAGGNNPFRDCAKPPPGAPIYSSRTGQLCRPWRASNHSGCRERDVRKYSQLLCGQLESRRNK